MNGARCSCGSRLLTDEAIKTEKCSDCRDPGLYQLVRHEPDLEKQFAMYCGKLPLPDQKPVKLVAGG